jgi:hypothetical protein
LLISLYSVMLEPTLTLPPAMPSLLNHKKPKKKFTLLSRY